MGREIRRVPADWEHPRYSEDDAPRPGMVGDLKPLYDEDYETASEKWMADLALWQQGAHPSQPCDYCRYFWEWDTPPDENTCRSRKWSEAEATHYQVYQTVSEGTPVTPHFATKDDLVDYLVEHGDFWDQERGNGGWQRNAAEQFVASGWAPSLMVSRTSAGVEVHEPRDGLPAA